MATNDFKPFAVGSNANVTSQSDYEDLAALSSGFQAGKASSAQVNKSLRQGTVMASVLAQFIADKSGNDVLDDGKTSAIYQSLLTALEKFGGGLFLQEDNNLSEILSNGSAAQLSALQNLGIADSVGFSGLAKRLITITSSGTYTPTTGTKGILVIGVSGGGGGSGCSGTSTSQTVSGAGGGAGGTGIKFIKSLKSSYSVTVGTGGSGSPASGSASSGSQTAFDSEMTITGGGGGSLVSSGNTAGGVGGTSSGATVNIRGGSGSDGQNGGFIFAGNGGSSFFGGGGRAGARGGAAVGLAYGSGGGGTYDSGMSGNSYAGSAGANGIVLVMEFV